MVRHLNTKIAGGVLGVLLSALLLASCTYLPRPEETGTANDMQPEETDSTSAPETNDTESGQADTDADGFPNEPEDGHTKRY